MMKSYESIVLSSKPSSIVIVQACGSTGNSDSSVWIDNLRKSRVMVHRPLHFLCQPHEVGFDLNRDGLRLNHPQNVSVCFDVDLFPLAWYPVKCKRDGHRVKWPNVE